MKCAVIIYHSNASKIYKKEWIDKCIDSIKAQTVNYYIFELNYGEDDAFYTDDSAMHLSRKCKNHIEAMNYLIDLTVLDGYDIIFNTNLDDYYEPERFELQIKAILNGAQLVSSNFNYFSDSRGTFKKMDMTKYQNIGIQLRRGHNVIAHPVVAYHKSFFNDGLRYNDLLGKEDLDLWQRADKLNRKIVILPQYLLNYRIHENQITKTYKG